MGHGCPCGFAVSPPRVMACTAAEAGVRRAWGSWREARAGRRREGRGGSDLGSCATLLRRPYGRLGRGARRGWRVCGAWLVWVETARWRAAVAIREGCRSDHAEGFARGLRGFRTGLVSSSASSSSASVPTADTAPPWAAARSWLSANRRARMSSSERSAGQP